MSTIQATIGETTAILPANLRKPNIVGLRFKLIETPNATEGKFHAQIVQIQADGTEGRAMIGKYFPTVEAAAELLNKTFATVPAGCEITTK